MYTREQILNSLKNTKRKPVYTESMREAILSKPYFKKALDGLRKKNREAISAVLPHEDFSLFRLFEETGSRKEFSFTYEAPRKKLVVSALAAWLFDDREALTAAEDALWCILNEYSWAPPHHISFGATEAVKRNVSLDVVMTDDTFVIDLQAAECAATVAECVLILGEKMHPLLVKRALVELERRIFKPFLAGTFVWESKVNNWASVCASNVCLAALAVIDDVERLTDVLEKAFSSLERYLTGFASDGACLEGLGYWNYGFGPYVGLAKVLYDRTGGELDLFSVPIVEKVARFYSKCFFKGGRCVSFADGNTRSSFVPATHSILLWRYPDLVIPDEFINLDFAPDARLADSARFFTETTEDFVNSKGKLLGTHVLPEAQWYISSAENGVGIAAKGGHNGEPHNHNDVGSYQIYKNGKEIISDLGCGEYTKSYFVTSQRYECFAPSSRSHSVPIIDGKYQQYGEDRKARDTEVTENGISMDIAPAYDVGSLTSCKRSISFDAHTGVMELSDEFSFGEAPRSVTERLVTSGKACLDGDSVLIENDGEMMRVSFDSAVLDAVIGTVEDIDKNSALRTTTVIDLTVKAPTEHFTVKYRIE